jgi:outer membrane protein assembly factor BamB
VRTRPAVLLVALAGVLAICWVNPAALAQRRRASAPAWPMVQGGPSHEGVAPDAALPPYREAWDAEAGPSGHRGASGVVVVGELAIALGREEVVAVDASTGKEAWTVARAAGRLVTPAVSDDGRTLVYPEGTGAAAALIGLDLETRAVRWRFEPQGEIEAAPAIEYNAVYAGTRNGFVHAVDVGSGNERWNVNVRAEVRTPVAVAEGRVYAIAENSDTFSTTVFALDVDDGAEVWRYAPPGASTFTSGPVVSDGRIAFALGDRVARALDAASGRELWTTVLPAPAGSASIPAALGEDFVIADSSGTVARYDGRTGEREWRFREPAAVVEGSPLVVGDFVVVGLHDGVVAAFDGVSGRLVWDRDIGPGPVAALAPAGDLLMAAMTGADGGLVGLEHDPDQALRSVESPTVLHPGPAVTNFAIAFAAVFGGLLAAFRLLGGRRPPPSTATASGPAGPAERYR